MTYENAYKQFLRISRVSVFPELAELYKCAADACDYRISKPPADISGLLVFCSRCRAKIAMANFCKYCGQKLREDKA